MFYHAQLLGRSKLGFSKRKFSVSFVFRSTPLDRVLHHETARTRAACVSLSLFNNVKERRKTLRTSTPENRRQASAVCIKPLNLSLVSGDNKERSPTSGARSSVRRFIVARQPDCQADCRKKFVKDSTKSKTARKPSKTTVFRLLLHTCKQAGRPALHACIY